MCRHVPEEVAERIASKPGKKAYGILIVFLQAYYDIDYLFTVDKQQFDPPTAVQSAVIRLVRTMSKPLIVMETLQASGQNRVQQRRKTLRNSLKVLIGKDCPFHERAVFDNRPEHLSVQEFIELTNLVESCLTAS